MHSSWFRKPVHKYVSWLAALSIAGCITFYWLSNPVWPFLFAFSIILLAILAASSFLIRSGLYITTINNGNTLKNTVAITFDDGPCSQTMDIIRLLENYNAHASFFIIGSKAESHEDILREINNKMHTLGNHSYCHNYLFPFGAPSWIKKEIAYTQQIIKSVTGQEPAFFRPPFGVTNPLIAKALKNFNLKSVGWSVRSLDTVTSSAETTINRIKKRIKPGSIILLHDTSINIVQVLDEILLHCSKHNLKPVSLDEFLHDYNNEK